jgi:nucleotide-binding universal stress UspA family protein
VVAAVDEGDGGSADGVKNVAGTLGWQGIAAEARSLPRDARSIADQLEAAASECGADIMVMGGYSHRRARESVFGGCTQRFLEHAERPVLLMH